MIRKHIYFLCLAASLLLAACNSDAILDNGNGGTDDVATDLPISFGTRLATTGSTATRATAATAYAGEWRPTKALYGKTRKYANGKTVKCAYGDTIINNDKFIMYAIDSCRHSANTAGVTSDFCGIRLSDYIEFRAKGSGKYGCLPSFNILQRNNNNRAPLLIEVKANVTLTALYRRQTYSTADGIPAYAQNDFKDLKVRDITDSLAIMGSLNTLISKGLKDTLNMDGAMMYTPGTDLNRAGADIYSFATKTYNLKAGRTYVMYSTRTTIRLYGLEYSTDNAGNNILPGGTQAGVFGYHTASTGWTSTSSADFMYNLPMDVQTTTGSGNALDYPSDSPKRYWPNDDSKLSFWAYYPWNATVSDDKAGADNGININATRIDNGKGMGSILFTMKEDSREQVDFMVSDLVPDQTKADHQPASESDAPKPVSFTFHHMLSQIRIYIHENLGNTETNEWDEATLNTKVELRNIATQGTLTPQETYPDNNYRSWGWSTVPLSETGTATDPTQTGTALIEAYQTATLEFTETTIDGKTKSVPNTAIGFPPVNTLYVIPQVINGGTSGTSPLIKVTVNDKNNKPATLTAYLSDITWLPNHIYTYCITIDLSPGQEEHEYGLKGGVLWYADHQTETGFDVGGDETYDDDTPVGAAKRKRWQK